MYIYIARALALTLANIDSDCGAGWIAAFSTSMLQAFPVAVMESDSIAGLPVRSTSSKFVFADFCTYRHVLLLFG